MNLKRTTIIPIDDATLAKTVFDSYIEKEMMILMIIIGDTDTIRKAIPLADNLAKLTYFNMERWVLWVRNHETLKDTLMKQLAASDDPDADMDFNDVKCFCFSPVLDMAVSIVHKNSTLDYANLQQAFFKAQSHDTALTNPQNNNT